MLVDNKIEITLFPASAGDCILLEFIEEDYRMLIDGGYAETYHNYLKIYLKELSKQGKRINLLVITHIDADHIGGIQSFLKENGLAQHPDIIGVDEVWYNAFTHMNREQVHNRDIPYIIKEILRGSIVANNTIVNDGRQDISVSQGNTVAGLLKNNKYNWNTLWNNGAVCIENGKHQKLTDKIKCTLLGPDEKALNELAKFWVSKMKNRVKNFVICENELYNEAFECDCAQYKEESFEIIRKDIGYKIATEDEGLKWELLADSWNGQIDCSPTNRSSIAFMIEYDGIKMLFPGDSPLQLIQEELPDKIDVVKLPHHGSERNIDKEFIQNKEVSYYLLSTEGKIHGHPSKAVIGSILCKEQSNTVILKNYDISWLKDVGILVR